MIITKVEIEKNDDKLTKPKLEGLVTVIFDYGFAVHDIEIRTGNKGIYLVFPVNKYGSSEAYPITNDCRQYILDCILNELGEN